MKILFISDNAIYGYGGGSLENRKHYDALKYFCEKNGHELKVISMDSDLPERLPITIKKSKKIDIKTRLKGHSSFLFYVWFENLSLIKEYSPDLIYLGRSRFGFIAKSAKKIFPECKVITNIDNVELDYIDAYFSENNSIKNLLYKTLEKFVVYRDEKATIKYSDELIFLTQRNVIRYHDVYKYQGISPVIVPICLEKETKLYIHEEKKTVVFIGSLDYQANVVAVKKIITEIWKNNYSNDDRIQLLIAGRNPSVEIIELVQTYKNIKLIENFECIEEIIPINSLMLAPIEKGAGMKVKVAETLSMGLMIVASGEALVGYECIENNKNMLGIIKADSNSDYIKAIDNYLNIDNKTLSEIQLLNKDLYHQYYSYNNSRQAISSICDRLL